MLHDKNNNVVNSSEHLIFLNILILIVRIFVSLCLNLYHRNLALLGNKWLLQFDISSKFIF